MGIWYTSSTIVGYKITPNDAARIRVEKTVSSCSCNPPAGSAFCPKCGTKVSNRTQSYMTDEWDDFTDNFLNVGSFANHFVAEQPYDASDGTFWFGYGNHSHEEDEEKMIPVKPYDEIKAEIAVLLKRWIDSGLFVLKDENFGIWTLVIGR